MSAARRTTCLRDDDPGARTMSDPSSWMPTAAPKRCRNTARPSLPFIAVRMLVPGLTPIPTRLPTDEPSFLTLPFPSRLPQRSAATLGDQGSSGDYGDHVNGGKHGDHEREPVHCCQYPDNERTKTAHGAPYVEQNVLSGGPGFGGVQLGHDRPVAPQHPVDEEAHDGTADQKSKRRGQLAVREHREGGSCLEGPEEGATPEAVREH